MLWQKPRTPPQSPVVEAAAPLWSPPRSPSTSEGSSSGGGGERRPSSPRIRNPGRRIAQIVRLRPEYLQQYKEVHARVWPEVLKEIKNSNIQDYSIFHDEQSGILFASFKYVGYDLVGDMERMRENAKVREWWAMTDGFQESLVPGATSSESGEPSWWKPLEEVFYMQ